MKLEFSREIFENTKT